MGKRDSALSRKYGKQTLARSCRALGTREFRVAAAVDDMRGRYACTTGIAVCSPVRSMLTVNDDPCSDALIN